MKKINLFIISFLLFVSCSSDTTVEDEEVNRVDLKFTQFDVTLFSGEKSIGIIDNENKHISLPGVVNPLDIKSVTYKTSEDVSLITPTPESRIDSWEVSEAFILRSGSNSESYTVEISDYQKPVYENKATISPLNTFGVTTKYHMLDLNGNPNQAANINTANIAFNEGGMNGIRFPLYCGDYYGGHPAEGVVSEEAYKAPLKSLENAKAAYSGTQPFMIFLGVKVMTSNTDQIFPDWVTTDKSNVANPDKYAQLIVDFIEFMYKKGHVVNAVALDKESVRMGIDGFKIAVDSLRARTARLGYAVPKIVAPELLDPQGDKPSGYMNTLYFKKNAQSKFDVFGNHYYQRDHSAAGFAKLKYEYDLAQSDKTRESWATEAHWDNVTDIWSSETGIGCMFDWTDLGLDGFSWWSYPITGGNNARSYIIRAYSEAIMNSRPIRMLDHDGEETLTRWKFQSRAYLRGDEVNVFIINVVNPGLEDFEPISYLDYPIGILDGFKIGGRVTVRQWNDDANYEGEYSTVEPVEENQFLIDVPHGSFTQLTFKIIKEQ